jgi:hypothetical protein
MYTLHVISFEFKGNPRKFYRDITKNYVITWYPHSIPVNQIPFKYYNGNQSVGISKLQGLKVTCNPHKFEIPAL